MALRQNGLPVLGWTLVTGPTDPDRLLGRPGQYTSKVTSVTAGSSPAVAPRPPTWPTVAPSRCSPARPWRPGG